MGNKALQSLSLKGSLSPKSDFFFSYKLPHSASVTHHGRDPFLEGENGKDYKALDKK